EGVSRCETLNTNRDIASPQERRLKLKQEAVSLEGCETLTLQRYRASVAREGVSEVRDTNTHRDIEPLLLGRKCQRSETLPLTEI
ncbi:hypothetical protein RRG08_061419, partial [Elysia crispata]